RPGRDGVVALVDQENDQLGMLARGSLDKRHLRPAGHAPGGPEVDQKRVPPIVGEADRSPVERAQADGGGLPFAAARRSREPADGLQSIDDLRGPPAVAARAEQSQPVLVELAAQAAWQLSA